MYYPAILPRSLQYHTNAEYLIIASLFSELNEFCKFLNNFSLKIKVLEVDAVKMYADLRLNYSYLEKMSAKHSEGAYLGIVWSFISKLT
jgi:hypothetical protein